MRRLPAAGLLLALVAPGCLQDAGPVEVVQAYRAAVEAGDSTTARALLAPGARAWFEQVEGEGEPLDPFAGRWSAWDDHFRSEQELERPWAATGDTAHTVVLETNNFYRLLDRPGTRYRLGYWVGEDGRIVGRLIDGLVGPAGEHVDMGRMEEFLAWAQENAMGELVAVMPQGRIDPTQPRRFDELLRRWREAAGLPLPPR